MSLLVYPKIIAYTNFEHFGIIRFWVMLRTLLLKMHLLTLWLYLWPSNPKTTSLLDIPITLYLVWTLWDHSFLVMLHADKQTNKQTDRQTDRQTEGLERHIQSAWVTKVYSVYSENISVRISLQLQCYDSIIIRMRFLHKDFTQTVSLNCRKLYSFKLPIVILWESLFTNNDR